MYTFIPNEQEIRTKQFNLKYSCTKDTYERFVKGSAGMVMVETTKGWKSRRHISQNVKRNVEQGYDMVYLARSVGILMGMVSWKFDFSIQDMRIKDIKIKLGTATFATGKVDIQYLKDDGNPLASYRSLVGLSKFTIEAKFRGGQWDRAQIFRQGIRDKKDYPFEVNVQFM